MRVLYLQTALSSNGPGALRGRVLVERFRAHAEDCLVGASVVEDQAREGATDRSLRNDLISRSMFARFSPDVVYVEGGLFMGTLWKIPLAIIIQTLERGGVVLVADADINHQWEYAKRYRSDTARLFGASPTLDGSGWAIPLVDPESHWQFSNQIVCNPAGMNLRPDIQPSFDGVSEVVAGLPAKLSVLGAAVVASGNRSTIRSSPDDNMTSGGGGFFGAASNAYGGYAVLISALVSSDRWLERCPDNTKWLVQLAEHLLDYSSQSVATRAHYLKSEKKVFLSHRSVDSKVVTEVDRSLKSLTVGTWFAPEDIVVGDSFVSEISQALGEMSHFVLFWSASCVGAPWVQIELDSAVTKLIDNQIPLIVVALDETPVPDIVGHLHRIMASELAPSDIAEAIASELT